MTLPLVNVGMGDLRRINDAEVETMARLVQQVHANNAVNGLGRVAVGAGTGIGSAVDTYGTTTSHHAFFRGDAARSSITWNYGQNKSFAVVTNNIYRPLFWNGTALQRSDVANLATEIFPEIKSQLQTGNELGAFRVATTNPGTGWVDRGTFFQDRRYNNPNSPNAGQSIVATYNLYLKTGGVSTPVNYTNPLGWNGNEIQAYPVTAFNSAMVVNGLYPLFSQWASTNINYVVNTAAGTAAQRKGSFNNTTYSGHRDFYRNLNDYETYPSYPLSTTTYWLRLT